MNLADALPTIKDQIATMEQHFAAETDFGRYMAAQIAGTAVSLTGDVLNQVIAGKMAASPAEEDELREIYDALVIRRAEIDTIVTAF